MAPHAYNGQLDCQLAFDSVSYESIKPYGHNHQSGAS